MYMYIHVHVPTEVAWCCKPSSHCFHTQLPVRSMIVHWGSGFPLPLNSYASYPFQTDKRPFPVMMRSLKSGATLGCSQYVHTCTSCMQKQLTVMCQCGYWVVTVKRQYVTCTVCVYMHVQCTKYMYIHVIVCLHIFSRPALYIHVNRWRTTTLWL